MSASWKRLPCMCGDSHIVRLAMQGRKISGVITNRESTAWNVSWYVKYKVPAKSKNCPRRSRGPCLRQNSAVHSVHVDAVIDLVNRMVMAL